MCNDDDKRLIDPVRMSGIDAAAEASGIDVRALMERAGRAVAASALKHYPGAVRYAVLCGTGNNGGDGFVAALALREAGAKVSVYLFGDSARLKGAARQAYENLRRAEVDPGCLPLVEFIPQDGEVVIDAIFGAGLSRDVPPDVSAVIHAVTQAKTPVIAVDLPSGLCGRRGIVLGTAFKAAHTVTFVAKKPGHVLMPGRELCGCLEVFDIGIPRRIVDAHCAPLWENHPGLWENWLTSDDVETHKFKRGHLTVFSGPSHSTGAARMTAIAGLRAGAGIVTVAAPQEAMSVLAATMTAVMVTPMESEAALSGWLADKRHATFVIGPGFGDLSRLRAFVSLLRGCALVLDADGITAFKDEPETLFAYFAEEDRSRILTPHEGEFARLFPSIHADRGMGKIEKALAAAKASHAVIIYKGADTVVAAPDGRATVNTNAPASLATAGSGDVLAGICGGLLARQVPAFEAAAAAVWLHGQAAQRIGAGLTAEDLASAVCPSVHHGSATGTH